MSRLSTTVAEAEVSEMETERRLRRRLTLAIEELAVAMRTDGEGEVH